MNRKLFISHSSHDRPLAQALSNFLVAGVGVPGRTITCTSIELDAPRPGEQNYHAAIRARLDAASTIIALVTQNFNGSPYCLCEVGAAWGARKSIIPVVVPPLSFSDVPPVLSTAQGIDIANSANLATLRDAMCDALKIRPMSTARFDRERASFLSALPSVLSHLPEAFPVPRGEFAALAAVSPRLCTREELDDAVGDARERMWRVQQDLRVSGNDCAHVVTSLTHVLSDVAARGVQVRIICVDPHSAAAEMLTRIDPQFLTVRRFRSAMAERLSVLSELKKAFPQSFDFRLLPFLPAFGLFITDPTLDSGVVKLEIYAARPWSPFKTRPHIILPPRLRNWRQYFVTQWDNYWKIARPYSKSRRGASR